MHLTALLPLLAATATSGSTISKRCSPPYDPQWHHGFLPPAPCWQTFDPSCKPYLRKDTQMTIDAPHNLVIVYGIDQWCAADIKEELAREIDGRKTWGYRQTHGRLTLIEGGILVISNMTDANVAKYQALQSYPW
ncbi:hypothetical protein QBC38DRAFT_138309 [Podospora fimiseda]|uniref:Ecp2 effector protein domain-containing protein n=1 Tax=Podospora fimiseda TaxID=252190 RepID=A0AAN6YM40_9PEZI|nr:hypothetical protein QBC38DRAFT_138309 [Podospora fimiseda]